MASPTDDDLLLTLMESVTLDVLDQIGDDSDARYAFFKKLLAVAQETVRQAEAGRAAGPH